MIAAFAFGGETPFGSCKHVTVFLIGRAVDRELNTVYWLCRSSEQMQFCCPGNCKQARAGRICFSALFSRILDYTLPEAPRTGGVQQPHREPYRLCRTLRILAWAWY